MDNKLLTQLISDKPKKILSLDGGGITGGLSLDYLKKNEAILRAKESIPNYVLSDYFDLIGGTSAGAIIATLLTLGKSVDDFSENDIKYISEMSNASNRFLLCYIGVQTAKKEVSKQFFNN